MSVEAAAPLTITGASLDGEAVALRCRDGAIVALGPEVAPQQGDETIDAGGAPLVAPLLNAHTHAAMTLFRGYGGDLPLMRWLREKIWPVEAKLEAEDVYWGARLACLEMVRTGTTRFWDMYWHPEETARAILDAGLRATVGAPLFDADGDAERLRETACESVAKLRELDENRVAPALTPHAIYTVSEESLRWTGELAAEQSLPVHIHLSETAKEVDDCLAERGVRPAAYLDRLGLLGAHTVLAHGVWLDREELELIAERGCVLAACPVANMKLAVGGVLPYPAAREAGVAVGLGTDGAGSNDSLDLFSDLKTFALTQRHAAGDATVIPAAEAWAVATGARAPLLGGTPLAVGAPADFLLLRRDAYEIGLGDLAANLVYAAGGSIVDTTVVAGRVLMRDGEVPEAAEIVTRAAERAGGLGIG